LLAGAIRDQAREALFDLITRDQCGTWVLTAGHHVADDILKLEQKFCQHKVLVDQVYLPGIRAPSGRPSWLHISWIRLIVCRSLRKCMLVRGRPRKCMLVLAKGILERTFVSIVQDASNVAAGVGNTDAMIVRPSTALELLGHVKE